MQSANKWSEQRKAAIKRGLRRSWAEGGTRRDQMLAREVDADTVRKRALWDRKGAVVHALAGLVIRHSLRRTDSYDVLSGDGAVVCTGGKAKVGLFLGSLLP